MLLNPYDLILNPYKPYWKISMDRKIPTFQIKTFLLIQNFEILNPSFTESMKKHIQGDGPNPFHSSIADSKFIVIFDLNFCYFEVIK